MTEPEDLVVAPKPVQLAARGGADDVPAGGSGRPRDVRMLVLGGVAAALLIATFALLPGWVAGPAAIGEPAAPAVPAPGAARADARPPATGNSASAAGDEAPFQAAEQHALRTAAQDALSRFITARDELLELAGQRWAAADLDAARQKVEHADGLFVAGDHAGARDGYTAGAAQLEARVAAAPAVRDEAVANGLAELAAQRTDAAIAAFETALAITPDHPPALAGLRRAEVADDVRRHQREAQQHEQDDDAAAALAAWRAALQLDPADRLAREGAELNARVLADRAWTAAMGDGFAALQAGRLDAAAAAFDRAAQRGAPADELAEARRQLATAADIGWVEQQRAAALALEAEQRWIDAGKVYEAIVARDAALVFAREGLAAARARARLERDVDAVLAAPERLSDDARFAAARALAAGGGSVAAPGERIAGKLARLAALLDAAATPVPVILQSDGQTRVTVFKVGELGTFAEQRLELRPGAYIITGTRDGYRDVRREVIVGAAHAVITVQCTEPIPGRT